MYDLIRFHALAAVHRGPSCELHAKWTDICVESGLSAASPISKGSLGTRSASAARTVNYSLDTWRMNSHSRRRSKSAWSNLLRLQLMRVWVNQLGDRNDGSRPRLLEQPRCKRPWSAR